MAAQDACVEVNRHNTGPVVGRGSGRERISRPRGGAETDARFAVQAGDGPGVRRFAHHAMATVFEVYTVHPDEHYAAQAAHAAFDVVDRLERDLSRFLPNSDIARIGDLEAGRRTRVSPSTLECLLIARRVFDLTGGAFDVSVGKGLSQLEIDPDDCVVWKATDGVRIDLGGIGKGYAVDRMAELLEEWGLEVALVHGGFSSVLALESPPDAGGWPLTFSHPHDRSHVLARVSVRRTALGASGLRKQDHIVDPRSGKPAGGQLAVWVAVDRSAPRPDADAAGGAHGLAAASVADALATAFMVLGAPGIEEVCGRTSGLEVWVLPESATRSEEAASLLHFGGRARV